MSVQSVVEWARQPNIPVRPSALALANGVRVVWTPYSGTVSQKAAYRFGRSGLGARSATDNAFQVGKDAAVQKAAAAFAVVLIDVGDGYSGASPTRLIGTRGTAEGDGNRRGWEISADGGTFQDWVLQAFNSGGRSPVVIWSSSVIPAAGDLQLVIIEVSRDASNTYGTIYSSINGGVFSTGSGTVTGVPFGDDTGSNYLEVGGKMAGTATTDTVSIVLAAWGVGATSAAFREELRRNPWRLAKVRSIWVPVASVAGGPTYSASLTESVTAGDAATSALIAAATLAEAATLADAPAATAILAAAVAEAITAAETAAAALLGAPTITEAATLGDSASAAATLAAALAEAASGSDAITAAATLLASLSEAAALAEGSTTGAVLTAAQTDAATLAETIGVAASLVAAVLEAAATSDATTAAAQLVALVTEAATAADAIAGAVPATYSASVAELVAAIDLLTAVMGGAAPAPSASPIGRRLSTVARRDALSALRRPANLSTRTR